MLKELKSPKIIPVNAFKLTEYLTNKLARSERTRKKAELERVTEAKEDLEKRLDDARIARKFIDDNTHNKHERIL